MIRYSRHSGSRIASHLYAAIGHTEVTVLRTSYSRGPAREPMRHGSAARSTTEPAKRLPHSPRCRDWYGLNEGRRRSPCDGPWNGSGAAALSPRPHGGCSFGNSVAETGKLPARVRARRHGSAFVNPDARGSRLRLLNRPGRQQRACKQRSAVLATCRPTTPSQSRRQSTDGARCRHHAWLPLSRYRSAVATASSPFRHPGSDCPSPRIGVATPT
jgi:hypothetical protein